MAVNTRFEINSSSPDGVSFRYSGTHRGHFGGGPNFDRGSSFRENHDVHLVIQGMAGQPLAGSGSSGHGERQPLTQVLALDPISSGEQKYARQLELRRATIAAIGQQGEVHGNLQSKPLEQQGLEELKRIKASLIDNAARARERSRGFAEATSKLEKYRASRQTRKRVRTEASVHERPMTSLLVERPATAGNSIKATFCASPNHASMADSGTPKPEDKNKGLVPNKRIRTSMVDVRLEGRANTSSLERSTGLADRDRDSFKTNSSLAGLVEDKDRTVSIAGESWEKTKMKGRRSATKSDSVAISPAANGTPEVEREHKWGAQHRNSVENRPRSREGHGFRGPVHGVVSIHKVEIAQQNVVPICSVSRNDSDGSPSVGEKVDRLPFPEKERLPPVKNGVKLSYKEGPLPSPPTVTKLKAARAPRSSSAVSVNPSAQHASRPPPDDAWDRSAPSRSQLPVGPINRKRSAASRPSSPPVAQWVGQRPQKMSRVARRMNLVPLTVGPTVGKDEVMITTGDGNSGRDTTATAGARSSPIMPAAAGPIRRVVSTATISQNKPKIERATPSMGVSESDDSEGGDLKSKEKWKKHGESEGRFATVSQKMAPMVVPGKKSCVGSKEEGRDGVRRQGRSSRGLIAVRETPIVTHVEKVDPAANAKQLRSARPGLDKLEKPADVKPGRPPTKKGTADRKALTRPRRPPTNSVGDVSGDSDDDHEELVAAVQAAVNSSAAACPNSFWKEMEPFFAYLTPDEQEGLRKQARELEEVECSLTLPISDNSTEKDIVSPMQMWNESIAAITPESPVVNVAGKVTCLSNGSIEVDGGAVSKAFNNLKDQQVRGLELRRGWPDKGLPLSQRLLAALIIEGDSDDGSREDGSQVELQGAAGDRYFHDLSDCEQAQLEKKDQDSESEVETRRRDSSKQNGWVKSPSNDELYTFNGHRHWDSESELLNSPAKADDTRKEGGSNINGLRTWNIQYQTLKLDDRIAMELQSLGLYPDLEEIAGVEDYEVAEQLKKSHKDLKDQIHTNKERLLSLGMVVSNCRVSEERQRERLAMLKLVEIAFDKRVGCRGGVVGASGSKSSASKAARAAALTFTKRTLARWQHFAETGESCFTDAGLRDILFCISSKGPGRLCHASDVEKGDKESSESGQVMTTSSECLIDKDDMWYSRPKEREVLLEDVVGSGNYGNATLGGTKGKRTERERDGKGQGKEIVGRGGDTNKGGRQGLSTIKGERKTKTKPRQKTALLVNGLLGKPQELKESSPVPLEKSGDRFMKAKDEPLSRKLGSVGERQQPEAVDLTHLQIPSMDDFVVNGDLEGQGQDLGSWLDFEDPGLPDAGGDFMGLDVPMDDLADLAMMM